MTRIYASPTLIKAAGNKEKSIEESEEQEENE